MTRWFEEVLHAATKHRHKQKKIRTSAIFKTRYNWIDVLKRTETSQYLSRPQSVKLTLPFKIIKPVLIYVILKR